MSVFVSTGLISTPGAPCNLKELQKTIPKDPCDSKVTHTHTPPRAEAKRIKARTVVKVCVRAAKTKG